MHPQKRGKMNNRNTVGMIAVALVALVALVILLTGGRNTISDVKVLRSGNATLKQYVTDEDIIRATGIKMGASMSSIDNLNETAKHAIDELGYVSLIGIRQLNKNTVEIAVENRVPCAAISVGANYAVLDSEGYVMGLTDDVSHRDAVIVNGVTVTQSLVGRKATVSTPSQLDEVLLLGRTAREYGFLDMISNVNVYNGEWKIVTAPGLLARFYMDDDLLEVLEIVNGFLNQGVTSGEVILSDGEAAYMPRDVEYDFKD